ncbi:unnamed protein product [Rotaria sp. Silwood1]|nr:unnamed protein product [Rotaria sp. Silwood1]CAF5039323.1 unnamed protein product [Rotaria sp. Silwood1]CAF5039329.1 unnamed protein product [Rotaria sp. Silwood1]
MEELHLLVHHVQQCIQFTIDTESEKSNGQLALIQMQTISPQLPFLAILIELQHLPSNHLPTYVKIKEFFSLVFRSGNKLYSWDDMDKELEPIQDYHLFNWSLTASLIDIQLYFPDWYEWALAHCESCRPNHHRRHPDGINYDNVTTQNYSSSMCVCHEQSPYRPNEKWALQKALSYAAHMFIDKSSTVNNWAAGLTSNNSTLSFGRRKKMINYAIYDCFSTTYLIRLVLEKWTFNQLKDTNIVDLFTSFKSLPLPTINSSHKKNKKLKKNINLQKLFNINDDDLQPISDDDEIYLKQLIEPVTNEQPGNEKISNDKQEFTGQLLVNDAELISEEDNEIMIDNNQEGQPAEDNDNDKIQPAAVIEGKLPTTKRRITHQQRSRVSRQRRNRKQNNTHRIRRYHHYITRSILRIFGDEQHLTVSLRSRDRNKPINILTGIDCWLNNLMCNVPELAVCYYVDGIVQSYEINKTEDIPYPNATTEGHIYWLFKGSDDDIVALYDLTSLCETDCDDNPYEPVHISHDRPHRDPAQSKSSDLAQSKGCDRGKSSKNFGASRFKKY